MKMCGLIFLLLFGSGARAEYFTDRRTDFPYASFRVEHEGFAFKLQESYASLSHPWESKPWIWRRDTSIMSEREGVYQEISEIVIRRGSDVVRLSPADFTLRRGLRLKDPARRELRALGRGSVTVTLEGRWHHFIGSFELDSAQVARLISRVAPWSCLSLFTRPAPPTLSR